MFAFFSLQAASYRPAAVEPQMGALSPPCLLPFIIQSVIRPTPSQSVTLPANPLDETLTSCYRPTARRPDRNWYITRFFR